VYDTEQAPMLGTPTGMGIKPRQYSEQTAHDIDLAVREIVDTAFNRARDILQRHRGTLEEAAEQLLQTETLQQEELARYAERVTPQDGGRDDVAASAD
jgi:cell division protease FtsH